MKTPEGIVSYPQVFKAVLNEISDPPRYEFTCDLLFDKKDPEVKELKDAIEKKVKDKFGGKLPNNWKNPLKDGDARYESNPKRNEVYKGKIFCVIKSSEDQPPRVMDTRRKVLDSRDEFYAGCFARANVNLSVFDHKVNKGCTLYFDLILKTRDGERLDTFSSGEDELSDFFDDEAVVTESAIDDLLG